MEIKCVCQYVRVCVFVRGHSVYMCWGGGGGIVCMYMCVHMCMCVSVCVHMCMCVSVCVGIVY